MSPSGDWGGGRWRRGPGMEPWGIPVFRGQDEEERVENIENKTREAEERQREKWGSEGLSEESVSTRKGLRGQVRRLELTLAWVTWKPSVMSAVLIEWWAEDVIGVA